MLSGDGDHIYFVNMFHFLNFVDIKFGLGTKEDSRILEYKQCVLVYTNIYLSYALHQYFISELLTFETFSY